MYAVFTTYLLVVSVGITLSYPTDVQNWPLLQQIQKQADRLQRTHSNTASNVQALHTGNIAAWNEKADVTSESVVSSSPPPFGTMTNVCDNFCAKWCRKSQLNGERECHYVCTNLCDKKIKASNPYIGNPDYEVIASVFNFDAHDANKDKLISKSEFSRNEMVSMEDVEQLFTFADANSDGFIDKQEYQGGPLLFTEKIRLERQTIHLKYQTLFSLKTNKNQFVVGCICDLRFKVQMAAELSAMASSNPKVQTDSQSQS